MRCSCRLETMRSWLWHPDQSHLVTLQLCIARQTWIQNSNDQDSERDLKIDEQINLQIVWLKTCTLHRDVETFQSLLYLLSLLVILSQEYLCIVQDFLQPPESVDSIHIWLTWAPVPITHLSHTPRLRRISQSVSRVSDQSGSSQLTAGLAGPTPTLWRHSVTASVTHLPLGSASSVLSHVTGGVMQQGFSRVILRLWSQLRWGGSAANESRLWRQTRGWLSWGGQQASASNPHEICQINNCFKWTQNFKEKESESNAKNCVF